MTKTVDQWAAEQCGVELYTKRCTIPDSYDTYNKKGIAHWFDNGVGDYGEWTIQDTRCREIVREHFLLGTLISIDNGKHVGFWCFDNEAPETSAFGQTIEDAEIACIQAIYEAQK